MKLIFLLLAIVLALTLGQRLGVRLEDIRQLTFRKDVWITNVRDPPTTQLVCAGGNARRNSSQVKLVRCSNLDGDWNCTVANLDSVLNFTKVSINCEGANHPDDEYILPLSCYLEYTLNYMPAVQLINLTNTTPLVNVTNDNHSVNNSVQNGTFWPFNELSDDPATQQVMLLGTAVIISLSILMCNCSCNNNSKTQRKQVVDNAEDASGDSEDGENEEVQS